MIYSKVFSLLVVLGLVLALTPLLSDGDVAQARGGVARLSKGLKRFDRDANKSVGLHERLMDSWDRGSMFNAAETTTDVSRVVDGAVRVSCIVWRGCLIFFQLRYWVQCFPC
jgi:hypothetical protein